MLAIDEKFEKSIIVRVIINIWNEYCQSAANNNYSFVSLNV